MGPNFLGIGGHKTGTTWLYSHMATHPDISFKEEANPDRIAAKERHFWCRAIHERYDLDPETWPPDQLVDRYLASFSDGAKASGEITPHYAVMPERFVERATRALPEVRLLYIVRDPRKRAFSHAWARVNRLAQEADGPTPSHARVWSGDEAAPITMDDAILGRLREFATGPLAMRNGSYGDNIRRWLRHVDRDRLLVLRNDQFRTEPREALRSVFEHLGVDPGHADAIDEAELTAWVNPNQPSPPVPKEVRDALDEAYREITDDLADLMGWDLSSWKVWSD